jgi:hypothetical protein
VAWSRGTRKLSASWFRCTSPTLVVSGRSRGAVTDEEQGQQDEEDESEEWRAELLDVVPDA